MAAAIPLMARGVAFISLAEWIARATATTIDAVYAFFRTASTLVLLTNTVTHILVQAKHGFSKKEKCGEQCIKTVSEQVKITGDEKVDQRAGGTQLIEKTGICVHGCSITLRINVDAKLENPRVTTGWHDGHCLAS